ncbi:hypothetical protein FSW04_15790 [Baekduia soli]|uniref:Uncharacterized protein n=1 Tax=Baekduia soli TaxID=496014 RepID=A0A5B8U7H4_9ACTN|nr:hypothetical protein [Baekduia soli]QEC48891.1 hypothetical protein FSW04_15790 [Baekduia soli]
MASQRELHETLLTEHAGALPARIAANAHAGTTGEARLRGGIDAFFAWVQERPEGWRELLRDAADPDAAGPGWSTAAGPEPAGAQAALRAA